MRTITLALADRTIRLSGDDGTNFTVGVPVATSGWYHIASIHAEVDGAPEVQIMARCHAPVEEIVKGSHPVKKKRWWQR